MWRFGVQAKKCVEDEWDLAAAVPLNKLRAKEVGKYLSSEINCVRVVYKSLLEEKKSRIIPPISPHRCSLLRKVLEAKFKVIGNAIEVKISLTPKEEAEIDTEFSEGCFSERGDVFEEDGRYVIFPDWFCCKL